MSIKYFLCVSYVWAHFSHQVTASKVKASVGFGHCPPPVKRYVVNNN